MEIYRNFNLEKICDNIAHDRSRSIDYFIRYALAGKLIGRWIVFFGDKKHFKIARLFSKIVKLTLTDQIGIDAGSRIYTVYYRGKILNQLKQKTITLS